MVVKVYISGISGNKEVKKRQQRVLMILDSKHIKYEIIDITEPGREADKDFMQSNSKSNGATVSDPNPRSALPPQIFNDEEYCGDYDQFDLANEVDTLEQFVKVEAPPEEPPQVNDEQEKAVNGVDDETKTETTEAESEVAPESSETKDETKEGSPVKEDTTIKDAASKEGTPAKDDSGEAKEDTKEASEKDSTDRAKSVDKEATPKKAQSPEPEKVSKESSPEKEVNKQQKDSASKESSPEKEINEQEKENASKESSPEKEVNENGTASSRGQSEEKDAEEVVERKKDNPSEALIQSEQAAAE